MHIRHCPIVCNIKCNFNWFKENKSTCKVNNRYKYLWNDSSRSKFLELLNCNETLEKFQAFLDTDFQTASKAAEVFEDILKSVANNSLKKLKLEREGSLVLSLAMNVQT